LPPSRQWSAASSFARQLPVHGLLCFHAGQMSVPGQTSFLKYDAEMALACLLSYARRKCFILPPHSEDAPKIYLLAYKTFTEHITEESNAIGSDGPSVHPFPRYLLNRVKFDLDLLHVYGS